MFKKLKSLILPLVVGVFIASAVSAQIGGGSIGTPSLWKVEGNAILPITSTNEIGSSSERISKIWATDGDFSSLSFGGIATSDIDMQGNDILNVDQIKGNSQAVHIGTGTPTNASGEGSLYVQSIIETDAGVFTADNTGLILGDSTDSLVMLTTTDANANALYLGVPMASATNTPSVIIGESMDAFTDFGILHGKTEPGITLLNSSTDKALDLRWNGTFFNLDSPLGSAQLNVAMPMNISSPVIMGSNLSWQFYNGTGSAFMINSSGYLRLYGSNNAIHIGSTGTPSLISSPTNGDLYINGDAEVNERLHLGGSISKAQGADIASANNLTLGTDGNTFEITGTTQINCIDTTDWTNGSEITLWFTSTPTVANNQACLTGNMVKLLLDGGANYTPGAGDGITLQLVEIGGAQAWRSVGIHNL